MIFHDDETESVDSYSGTQLCFIDKVYYNNMTGKLYMMNVILPKIIIFSEHASHSEIYTTSSISFSASIIRFDTILSTRHPH